MTNFASSTLFGLLVRYGIITPRTFSLPRASAASTADTAESTPPETPITAFENPAFVVWSLINLTRMSRTIFVLSFRSARLVRWEVSIFNLYYKVLSGTVCGCIPHESHHSSLSQTTGQSQDWIITEFFAVGSSPVCRAWFALMNSSMFKNIFDLFQASFRIKKLIEFFLW